MSSNKHFFKTNSVAKVGIRAIVERPLEARSEGTSRLLCLGLGKRMVVEMIQEGGPMSHLVTSF